MPALPYIVGFDFGTHSTKVVLRKRGEEKRTLLDFGQATTGYPWFAAPSLVRLLDGRLYFGAQAAAVDGGYLYRSLKVHLLPPRDVDPLPFPRGPAPDILVAAYLSWLLDVVRTWIHEFGPSPVRLNLAAPMDHLEEPTLKMRYLQIIHAAFESVFGPSPRAVLQGASLNELEGLAEKLSENAPPIEVRHFDVLPETVAPIVSLSQNPRMAAGTYVMVDAGAGTTEMSVNHVSEPGAEQRVLCYMDRSIVLGGDDFERMDALPDESRQPRTDEIMDGFRRTFRETCFRGFELDSGNVTAKRRWRKVRLLRAGGATHRPELRCFLERALPLPGADYVVGSDKYEIEWHVPANLTASSGRSISQEDGALLTVADGLSVERQHWPVRFQPRDIEPLPKALPPEREQPYWYVEGK